MYDVFIFCSLASSQLLPEASFVKTNILNVAYESQVTVLVALYWLYKLWYDLAMTMDETKTKRERKALLSQHCVI